MAKLLLIDPMVSGFNQLSAELSHGMRRVSTSPLFQTLFDKRKASQGSKIFPPVLGMNTDTDQFEKNG